MVSRWHRRVWARLYSAWPYDFWYQLVDGADRRSSDIFTFDCGREGDG